MISVAMTTYNGEKYIKEQLESILFQSYTDLEVIVCDDGSQDRTVEIIREFQKTDKRIKLFINERNLGFKKNFEKAITLCSGEYIALCDQDDIWYKNHLQLLYSNIEGRSLSCANALLVDGEGKTMGKLLSQVDRLNVFDTDTILYKILLENNCFQGASMLIDRSLLNTAMPIPETIPFHDVWFSCCASLEKGISYSFEVITNYRQHGNNVTFTSHNKIGILNKIKANIKKIFWGIKSDRFIYVEELKKIYGNNSCLLNNVASLFTEDRLLINKKNVKFLKTHYLEITARDEGASFIKDLLKWKLWRK